METVKVGWAPQVRTAQIYSVGVELALISAKNEQIGPFVFCKDFFQDAIKGFFAKSRSSIYGYSYDPASMPPIDFGKVRLLLRNQSDPNFKSKVKGVQDLLNQVEKKMKLDRTELFETDKEGTVLLVGDGLWLRSPVSLSMYGLLARNGLSHKPGEPFMDTLNAIITGKRPGGQSHDGTYLQYGMPGIELIISKGINEIFGTKTEDNYKISVPTSTLHHYGGIVAFGSRHSVAVNQWPNWKFPEKATNAPGICFS